MLSGKKGRAKLGHSSYVRVVANEWNSTDKLSIDRLLTPSFRTTEVKSMFSDMLDIASQLVLKWERLGFRELFEGRSTMLLKCHSRFGPEYRLNPTEDFTRLTLDTIAICSMSYR